LIHNLISHADCYLCHAHAEQCYSSAQKIIQFMFSSFQENILRKDNCYFFKRNRWIDYHFLKQYNWFIFLCTFLYAFITNFKEKFFIMYLKKNLYYFVYNIRKSKKGLIMSTSNICCNLIFLIKELILRFADMWTYEIFEKNNTYLIQVIFST